MTAPQPEPESAQIGPSRFLFWGKPKRGADRLRSRERSSDVMVAFLGIALGLGCAMFPWYVFFNQEQFGIKAMQFSGEGGGIPKTLNYQPSLIMRQIEAAEAPLLELDLLSTGTLPDEDEPTTGSVPASQQPFPGEAMEFRLVHVANGRAMIEDADGLWMVQPGSRLPDSSRVAAIEQRQGRWVLVTNEDRVIPVEQ